MQSFALVGLLAAISSTAAAAKIRSRYESLTNPYEIAY